MQLDHQKIHHKQLLILVMLKQLIDWFATKVTGLGIAKSFIHIDNLTADDGFDMRPNAWKY